MRDGKLTSSHSNSSKYNFSRSHMSVMAGASNEIGKNETSRQCHVFSSREPGFFEEGGLTIVPQQQTANTVEPPPHVSQRRRMNEVVARLSSSFPPEVGKEDSNLGEESSESRVTLRLSEESSLLTGSLVNKISDSKRWSEFSRRETRRTMRRKEGRRAGKERRSTRPTSSIAFPSYPVPAFALLPLARP